MAEAVTERAVDTEMLSGAVERFTGPMEKLTGPMERLSGAVERFTGAGMALLPWTRHMIMVLWDQLRILVQVIYYTFISVFQMFRVEVHVSITDETSVTPDPSDPFLFSSLFSEEGGADPTEALLSTLRGEELCCDGEGGIFLGHKGLSAWSASATVGDWNFFVSSSEAQRSSDEGGSASCWSSEEEHPDFDCDESKALWESLSRSGDPYDPFCFSACISTCSKESWEREATSADCSSPVLNQKQPVDSKESWETESFSADRCSPASDPDVEEGLVDSGAPPVGRFWENNSSSSEEEEEEEGSEADESPGSRGGGGAWVRRSDSDSSWSSDCSEETSEEAREENQLLWDLFSNSSDPYNPLSFSASCRKEEEERDADEELWSGLSKEQDPYHPLNFTALEPRPERREVVEEDTLQTTEHQRPRRQRGVKPSLTQRKIQRHTHPQVVLRPWTKPSPTANTRSPRTSSTPSAETSSPGVSSAPPVETSSPEVSSAPPPETKSPGVSSAPPPETRSLGVSSAPPPDRTIRTQRKVHFSSDVQVHVMRSWDFARRSCRRGVWEEAARDRERFRRRVQECERSVGACLRAEHRERVLKRIQNFQSSDLP